ncbi:glutathione S-transferase [Penicillium capsulatum]|uniref:Glutathione S-transferase n=1 Tax=Penicillium capsulatum TaxID=69766 RepID=A0A9W9HR18_9EURO|nr:glutathione S-transferase [Penicillium capsulatum]
MNPEKVPITLYRGFPGSGQYTWSPFVTKLEARMRFAGVSYRTEAGSPRTAPRGKIPYVEIGAEDGSSRTIADSTLIIKDLIDNEIFDDINAAGLTPAEKTFDLGLRALLEDRLYFVQSHEKWVENYYTMRDHVLGSIPYPVRILVGLVAYRKNVQTLQGQGTGRFSADEIAAMREELWGSLGSLLLLAKASRSEEDADGMFWALGGNRRPRRMPSASDSLSRPWCPQNTKTVRDFPVLEEYATKIHDRYFPEYTRWDDM